MKEPDNSFVGKVYGYLRNDPHTCGGEKLYSCNYAVKDLSETNHKQLRKNALRMHLKDMHDGLHRRESISILIIYIETVCAAYETLNKYHLSYTSSKSSTKEISWEFVDIKQVSM